MNTLRTAVIRLAHENPDLRPHLLPLLKKAKNVGRLTAIGLAFIRNVQSEFGEKFQNLSLDRTPFFTVLNSKGRFELDTLQYSSKVRMSHDLSDSPLDPGKDDYLLDHLRRERRLPPDVTTIEELNEFRKKRAEAEIRDIQTSVVQKLKSLGAGSVTVDTIMNRFGSRVVLVAASLPPGSEAT